MTSPKPTELEALRAEIGAKVRDLRKGRRWTQGELAERLGLSQARLSEIERGRGSFSAEQLLSIFQLFNVDASHFAFGGSKREPEDQLWNAVARLGALHLVESEQVLPSQRLQEVHDVLREVLVQGGPPRLLTALAPVLVAQSDKLQLRVVEAQLAPLGLAHRLGWLVENTVEALDGLSRAAAHIPEAARYRRASLVLSTWLEAPRPQRDCGVNDVLDASIRSEKSRVLVEHKRSELSARWGILSELAPSDFAQALQAAHRTTKLAAR